MAEKKLHEKSENRKEISINALYREGLDSNLVSSDFYFYLFYTGKIQIIFSCVCSLFKQSHIMQILGKMYEEVVKIKIYEKRRISVKSFYINGTVITMEDDALYAEAVCAENGKILQLVIRMRL